MSIDSLYNSVSSPTSAIGKLYKDHTDTRIQSANNQAAANYYSTPAAQAKLLASDQQIAKDFGIPLNQVSPQAISAYNQQVAARGGGFMDQTFMNKIVPMLAISGLTAGAGSALGGALAGTAATGTAAATSGALGASIGTGGALTGVGSALVGAGTGALGGGLSATMSGGNIGKGILTGGVLGAIGGGLKPFVQGATGLTGTTGNIVNNSLTGAGTGAVRGALSGQGAVAGALSGAQSGATSAAGNAVAGSIFTSGNTVSPQLTQSNNPSTPNVSVDPSQWNSNDLSPITTTGQYAFFDPTTGGVNGGGSGMDLYNAPAFQNPSPSSYNPGFTNMPVQGGGSTLGGGYSDAHGNTTAGNLTGTALNAFLSNMMKSGSPVGNGNPSGGNGGGLSSLLASLLGGGGGGGNGGLLSSLLGNAMNGGAMAVNNQANQYASQQYAGQTKFNPYNVNTNNGSTTFNGTSATSALSPGQQQNSNALNGLTQSSAAGLQAGPQAASQNYFDQLQNQDRQANNQFYSSNLDNQMANGVLSSSAGQYQSQAALNAINQKTANNQVMANNFGQNQQQQQLQQLTAGLNGSNQINQNQLAQLNVGGNLGGMASNANLHAYAPLAGANANSNIGNILSSMGNQASSGSNNNQSLLQLLGLG